jgi:outer membrane immunogenic protein
MRRFSTALFAAATLTLGSVQYGSAADMGLPIKAAAPVPVAAPWSWTGFYIGGNVGAGWGTTETSANIGQFVAPLIAPATLAFQLPLSSQTVNGFLGGGQLGYNWQFGAFVLGVEGDVEWENLQGNSPCLLILNCNVNHTWQADLTGRAGVVAFDRALVYLKGGAVWQHSNYTDSNSITITVPGAAASASASLGASETRLGALLGTGIEYGFLPNWSAKIEYNFEEFGSHTLNFPLSVAATGLVLPPAVAATFAAGVPVTIKNFDNIIKFGVNYRW